MNIQMNAYMLTTMEIFCMLFLSFCLCHSMRTERVCVWMFMFNPFDYWHQYSWFLFDFFPLRFSRLSVSLFKLGFHATFAVLQAAHTIIQSVLNGSISSSVCCSITFCCFRSHFFRCRRCRSRANLNSAISTITSVCIIGFWIFRFAIFLHFDLQTHNRTGGRESNEYDAELMDTKYGIVVVALRYTHTHTKYGRIIINCIKEECRIRML